ncbi:hypothetical protein BDY19DRAFT_899391 [Irpex rosettiformis]|uniref:Uncharacterized protein n=1 Tax=Irpex rosettiformis TaxID=378272 RepID=A0ACB8TPP7_9APHY|nr:hypothetical protein BDY19DRAFT_899391 [Irpex rosettiformis]
MLSSIFRNTAVTASRSTSANGRLAARRVARVRISRRYQTTNTASSTNTGSSSKSGGIGTHLAAGFGGGALVLVGAYTYYHFSGAKKAVDSAKSAHAYVTRTTATIAEKAPKNPSEVLQFLRSVAKSYTGVVPGSSYCVDSTFDSLDELHETHGEELNQILQGAFDDIKAVLKDVQQNETLDTATARKLVSILGKCAGEMNELGKKAGNDAFRKLEENYPTIAQTIGSSYNDLRGLAYRGGPEAKKLVEESITQIQDVLNTSGKNQQEAWAKAKELVQGKSQRLRELVWDKAAEGAKKNPGIEKLLKEYRPKFMQQGVSIRSLKEVLDRANTTGGEGNVDQGKLGELKDFIEDKAQEAQRKGWESLQEWVKVIPGSDKKISDADVQGLLELSKSKTADAKQLAEETYRDLRKVLHEKAGKAKKIMNEGADETK